MTKRKLLTIGIRVGGYLSMLVVGLSLWGLIALVAWHDLEAPRKFCWPGLLVCLVAQFIATECYFEKWYGSR